MPGSDGGGVMLPEMCGVLLNECEVDGEGCLRDGQDEGEFPPLL
jgi:hypothetical protein